MIYRASITCDKDFDEDLHPRDDHGKFSAGGMSSTVSGTGKGRTVAWKDDKGKDVKPAIAKRLAALGVPPAWKNVQLNDNPKAALQVKGTDAKGRSQYLYSKEHSEKAAAEKFARLKDFNKALPKINAAIAKDMKKGDETAAMVSLIAKTGFRVGSERETGGKEKAYGASTLTGKHVSVKGDTLTFKFVGKHGVNIEHTLTDKPLAQFIKPLAGKAGQLFPTANDAKASAYIKKVSGNSHFKTKDFRTWNGTTVAIKTLGDRTAKNEKEMTKLKKDVATVVSKHLGNTPTVALSSYIDPSIWGKAQRY